MPDDDRQELLDALDDLAGDEPSNFGESADGFDIRGIGRLAEALREYDDSARARRLRRNLQDWQEALRRLKRVSHEYDRAERDVIDNAGELARELRSGDA